MAGRILRGLANAVASALDGMRQVTQGGDGVVDGIGDRAGDVLGDAHMDRQIALGEITDFIKHAQDDLLVLPVALPAERQQPLQPQRHHQQDGGQQDERSRTRDDEAEHQRRGLCGQALQPGLHLGSHRRQPLGQLLGHGAALPQGLGGIRQVRKGRQRQRSRILQGFQTPAQANGAWQRTGDGALAQPARQLALQHRHALGKSGGLCGIGTAIGGGQRSHVQFGQQQALAIDLTAEPRAICSPLELGGNRSVVGLHERQLLLQQALLRSGRGEDLGQLGQGVEQRLLRLPARAARRLDARVRERSIELAAQPGQRIEGLTAGEGRRRGVDRQVAGVVQRQQRIVLLRQNRPQVMPRCRLLQQEHAQYHR